MWTRFVLVFHFILLYANRFVKVIYVIVNALVHSLGSSLNIHLTVKLLCLMFADKSFKLLDQVS